jgi:glucose repression regulatory protein TUP1
VRSIAISPDGKWVITGSMDRRVCVWDMRTAMLQCTLEGHKDSVWEVGFSPVGDFITAGSVDGFVTLWKCKTL